MRKEASSGHQQEHLYDTTEAYLTYKVGNRDVTAGSQQSTKRKVKTTSVKRYVKVPLSNYYWLPLVIKDHQKTKRNIRSHGAL